MTFSELEKKIEPKLPALYLDKVLPRHLRTFLRIVLVVVCIGLFSSTLLPSLGDGKILDGLFFLFLSATIVMFVVEFYYNSSRFSYLRQNFSKVDWRKSPEYALSEVIYNTESTDITYSFLVSRSGREVATRLGLSSEDIETFRSSRRMLVTSDSFKTDTEVVTLAEYAKALYALDDSFKNLLSSRSITSEDFSGLVDWIGLLENERERRKQFWSREKMEASPTIGTALSLGVAPEVSKYGLNIAYSVRLADLDLNTGYRNREIEKLENILVRTEEANAIIVDNDGEAAKDVVARLHKRIISGLSPFALEHRNIIELRWRDIIENVPSDKMDKEFSTIFRESKRAGNIILYIPDLPVLIAEARKRQVNIPSILEQYLKSPNIHVLAHASMSDFYYFIEVNSSLSHLFERVVLESMEAGSYMPIILEQALALERSYGGLFFTYPALSTLTNSAERYVTVGAMPEKAIDLLQELAPWVASNEKKVVTESLVREFIAGKLGVDTGEVEGTENDKLLHLEDTLHRRVIGQDIAISLVSSAMRRARTTLTDPKKPLASFLFLGPTGVGKTETVKALAESFFGSEDNISRLDMSEFSGADALPRLIGSVSDGHTGALADKLRSNPYGVLLLDEFEKAAPDVLNLFLRVIDEGLFTDAFGKEVSARNTIIIATSNAGSNTIWKLVREGKDLSQEKDNIVDQIIAEKAFKPELINRFSAVVLYKPLEKEELSNIAEIKLRKLQDRLKKEKSINIEISDELIDYLVLHGANEKYGARSINRVIEEKIEDVVAKKIIEGKAKAGSTIEISVKDMV